MMVEAMNKINILGIGISRITVEESLKRIGQYIADGRNHYVLACNVHTVMMSQNDDSYRRINNEADIALADGKPLVWAAGLLQKAKIIRIPGRELMSSLCDESLKGGYSHYFLGGREPVLHALMDRLKAKCPGLNIAGFYSPPFRPLTREEDARVIQMINESNADIVWVGLGAPKQELWIGEHFGKIKAPVMVAVGAAFDFLAGNVRQAPQWMQKAGLEWLYRFSVDPHRLWRRYVYNNPKFLYLLICQAFGLRKFTL